MPRSRQFAISVWRNLMPITAPFRNGITVSVYANALSPTHVRITNVDAKTYWSAPLRLNYDVTPRIQSFISTGDGPTWPIGTRVHVSVYLNGRWIGLGYTTVGAVY